MQLSDNVFIVFANHQLHQVEKAIEYFKMVKHSIIILNFVNDNEKGIIQDFGKTHSYKVSNLNNWVFKDLLKNSSEWREFEQKLIEIRNGGKSINLFTSQYLNDSVLLANNILKPSGYYLMDEGTASFDYADMREKNKEGILKTKIKSLLYAKYLSFPKSITYFTKYNFKITRKSDSIIKYKEEKVKNKIEKIDEDKVFYLGTSLVELGLMDRTNYFTYLKDIFEMYPKKKLYYIPHRKESLLKLSEIEKLGYNLKKIDVPFEMWYRAQKNIPGVVSSHYYATVLGNLIDLFQNLPKICGFVSPIFRCSKHDGLEHKLFLDLDSKGVIEFIDL